ncbi:MULTISPECIES: glutamate-5-semialdehyde dehydrogenase [Desulfotignum]|jgi:glutamate-5-semialdehyde dehydrogenase|uniref:Gamma-glutamyl phosphate reductase n=1 Tax=Desulfotignum phosphitoxidans DSM 13687 TaxID=1286635 RepID=S0G7H2_9BACT|nr:MULTISPECIES: glutamate-5-semialdehyde dehydrogenase [Desulfotignum]EMS80901.1 gamma-glutamyl phosphate reductase ProA [Desulfotignum phosphitoxidans DSM 13687]
MSIETQIIEIAAAAKAASGIMAAVPRKQKDTALMIMADLLETRAEQIKSENQKDVAAARENGLSSAMIDRLTITDKTIVAMAEGLKFVAGLDDPVGTLSDSSIRPNGLEIARMRIPLGVIGIIYESRPNVTVDAAGLCLKAGNAVILRGGSEALYSNLALAQVIAQGLADAGLPDAAAQVIPVRDREAVNILLKQEALVDLIIPRGGEGLIRHVVAHSSIPVLKHYKGVCHGYVDDTADLDMAVEISVNAKAQRPGVCNAMETLLVHEKIADDFLPKLHRAMTQAGVTLKGCEACCRMLENIQPATDEDWAAEYLDLILAVRVVPDMDGAMGHIAAYGSNHTEAIITTDYDRARRFVREVDASLVIVNASTRFNDGGELGLGAEIGISTSKLHAYGPMGIRELTTTKFVAWGAGQIRT